MIWDCFTFSNEFDVLTIRLHELEGVVDRFVLVESTETFRGEPKALEFSKHRDRFARWLDRIEHVVVDDLRRRSDASPWDREHFQRRAILRGLRRASMNDLILISDVDEIPRASAVAEVAEARHRLGVLARLFGDPLSALRRIVPKQLLPLPALWEFEQPTYYFALDWRVNEEQVRARGGLTRAVERRYVRDPQRIRFARGRRVQNAGWHFSFLGDATRASRKIKSFSHSEYDSPEFTDTAHLERCITLGQDPFGRFDLEPVDVDDTYPSWVQQNLGSIAHLLRQGTTTRGPGRASD